MTTYMRTVFLSTVRTQQATGLLTMSYSLLHHENFLPSLTGSQVLENPQKVKVTSSKMEIIHWQVQKS